MVDFARMKLVLPSVLAVLALSSPLAGQAAMTLEECDPCDFEMELVVRLGAIHDDVYLSPFVSVARDSKGHFLAGPTFNPGQFVVFDSTGNILRTVGRHGQGPGEMRGIRAIRVWSDSVFVLTHGFVHVFDQDYQYVRRFSAPVIHRRGYAATSDAFVYNGSSRTGNVIASSPDGKIVRETWAASDDWRPGPYSEMANLSSAGGTLAFSSLASYEISVLKQGTVTQFRRQVDWFRPWHDNDSGIGPNGMALARLAGLHVVNDSLVVALAARQERRRDLTDETVDYSRDDHLYWDTQVELIDIHNGRVLGSVKRPEVMVGGAGGPLVYSVEAESTGVVTVNVWRISHPWASSGGG